MKKLTALLLSVAMVFTCVACGNSGNAGNSGTGGNGGSATITDATELLTKTWEEYNKSAAEDVKFPIGGGDFENMTMDVPGKYDVTVEGGAEGLTSTYCVPADVIAKIDDVATGMHMMMSNNFTVVACHVTNAADVESVVSGIKEATLNNRWMCGMPEELLIVTVGEDYVVSVFGLSALVDTFQTALTTVYGDAVVVSVEENIAE